MTKYTISGYIGYNNFGDELIAEILCENLKKIGAENITLISANPNETAQKYNVKSVHKYRFMPAILNSDVLISGGGSLLQDITSSKSLYYYLVVILTALFLRKKVIIFAQGFTPFKSNFNKILTSFILKKCHKITVRDANSQKMLISMGIDSEIINDPAFGYKTKLPTTKNGICVQLRKDSRLTEEFLNNLAQEIKKYFPSEKIKLLSLQDSIDLPVIKDFAKILEKEKIEYEILSNLNTDEIAKTISNFEYLISMRYHSCLIGSLTKTKVLGINYDVKVKTLSKDIDFPIYNFSKDNLSEKIIELKDVDVAKYNLQEFNFEKTII